MDFGQEEIDAAEAAVKNAAGRVPQDMANVIRNIRAAEQWERYDSIVIGPGASNVDNGWFEDWATFANASQLQWFKQRSAQVGLSYANQGTERTDWAQDFYQLGVEYFAPAGMGEVETDLLDQQIMPALFVRELANRMSFRVKISDSDEIVLTPGSHLPAGYGTTGVEASQAPAPLYVPGQQGDAHVSNTWKFPEPIMLPAQARISVEARIDEPILSLLRSLPGCPGNKVIPPCGAGDEALNGAVPSSINYPNWYFIRVFFRGPRYLQLRGARSAS